jgi:hypothetical protein
MDDRGRRIGPAFVFDGTAGAQYDGQWHTRSEARAIARRLRVRFTIDC